MKHYELLRISKIKAKQLFNQGCYVHLLPCKISPGSLWIHPNAICKDTDEDFDKAVNAFKYYNCNYECGYYPHYYIMQQK